MKLSLLEVALQLEILQLKLKIIRAAPVNEISAMHLRRAVDSLHNAAESANEAAAAGGGNIVVEVG